MRYIFSLLTLFSAVTLRAQLLIDNDRIGVIPLKHADSASEKLPTYQYFAVGVKYPESSVALLKKVQEKMTQSGRHYTGDGFITFHFTVDRNGQMFGYSLSETDKQYQPTTFNSEFTRLLYDFVQSLNEWPKAHLKDGSPVNYSYYLSFQIKDGTIVTVAP
ncbi:hypothetical protein ACTHGU_13130 [Chitinophagaceae bacterium MMS25-I14]